jgi:dTDP-4-amino-4,6-dideoxygalactose transaminase/very-short-patch-repair endonuclease
MQKPITVTQPCLPPLEEFIPYLQQIWQNKWLTNNGPLHQQLEEALCDYLGVKYISIFTNGTLPLITALQALEIKGEVITTPYSFVATTHSLWWNGIKPVFVDIDPITCNIDPNKIEAAITPQTTAIMPVHVYGTPCDMDAIQAIADKYGLKVIYDAAHAFGVKVKAPSNSPAGGGRALYKTANPMTYEWLKKHSKEMRKNQTQAEDVLWSLLRGENAGASFRRQHVIMDYIVDFVCVDKGLVLEVDGGYHTNSEQKEADELRDQMLKKQDYTVLRFTNEQVIGDPDTILKQIQNTLQSLPKRVSKDEAWSSILNAGDMSTLSFHATKVFNTIEGGALICHSAEMKKQIDYLKNFGFEDEITVVAPGINGKMDEIRSAYGLLNLKQVDKAIDIRKKIVQQYRNALQGISGISFMNDIEGVRHNYAYFPIFVDAEKYGMTRDELYFKMKKQNVLGRRYFYPLISTFSTYKDLPSSCSENLPVSVRMADSVICLPIHHALESSDVQRIIELIEKV